MPSPIEEMYKYFEIVPLLTPMPQVTPVQTDYPAQSSVSLFRCVHDVVRKAFCLEKAANVLGGEGSYNSLQISVMRLRPTGFSSLQM